MAELLADKLRSWRGKLYRKEAAALLDLPLGTYRKYETGKRTPSKIALAELERRLERASTSAALSSRFPSNFLPISSKAKQ